MTIEAKRKANHKKLKDAAIAFAQAVVDVVEDENCREYVDDLIRQAFFAAVDSTSFESDLEEAIAKVKESGFQLEN